MKVVETGDTVAPTLEHVPESFRGDEGGFGAFLFDDGVGGDRESVADFGDHIGGDSQLLDAGPDAVKYCLAVVVRSTGHFTGQYLAVVTQENYVGECTADINSNPEVLHSVPHKLEDIRHDTLVGIWWQEERNAGICNDRRRFTGHARLVDFHRRRGVYRFL